MLEEVKIVKCFQMYEQKERQTDGRKEQMIREAYINKPLLRVSLMSIKEIEMDTT